MDPELRRLILLLIDSVNTLGRKFEVLCRLTQVIASDCVNGDDALTEVAVDGDAPDDDVTLGVE